MPTEYSRESGTATLTAATEYTLTFDVRNAEKLRVSVKNTGSNAIGSGKVYEQVLPDTDDEFVENAIDSAAIVSTAAGAWLRLDFDCRGLSKIKLGLTSASGTTIRYKARAS